MTARSRENTFVAGVVGAGLAVAAVTVAAGLAVALPVLGGLEEALAEREPIFEPYDPLPTPYDYPYVDDLPLSDGLPRRRLRRHRLRGILRRSRRSGSDHRPGSRSARRSS